MANDASEHGYRWRDGSVRQHPEPKPESNLKRALDVLARQPVESMRPALKPPTPEQYAKAYAEWVKEFEAWRAKHGTR